MPSRLGVGLASKSEALGNERAAVPPLSSLRHFRRMPICLQETSVEANYSPE